MDRCEQERSRDATLDPALRKVRLTFAGRAWRRRGLELRTQRRAAGLEAPGPRPRSWTRGPQPRRREVDITTGTHGLRSTPHPVAHQNPARATGP